MQGFENLAGLFRVFGLDINTAFGTIFVHCNVKNLENKYKIRKPDTGYSYF